MKTATTTWYINWGAIIVIVLMGYVLTSELTQSCAKHDEQMLRIRLQCDAGEPE